MYLNLPLMLTLFFGGYQMIILDVLHIFVASQLNESTRAQAFGNSLIQYSLNNIQKGTDNRLREQKVRNGEIVSRYLRLKTAQHA